MTDTTRATAAELAALASRIVEAGRKQYDAMTPLAQKHQAGIWQAQIIEATGCHRHTARKHIERAIARQSPPTWGRPAAGKPAGDEG